MTIRRAVQRRRRGLVCAFVTVVVVCGLAVHHSELASGAMHHEGMATVVEACLGAFTAVGAAVVAVAIGLLAFRWPRTTACGAPSSIAPHRSRRAGIRAGPAHLRLLSVLRL